MSGCGVAPRNSATGGGASRSWAPGSASRESAGAVLGEAGFGIGRTPLLRPARAAGIGRVWGIGQLWQRQRQHRPRHDSTVEPEAEYAAVTTAAAGIDPRR